MTETGSGPYYVVDGPPPQQPLYTLVGASRILDERERANDLGTPSEAVLEAVGRFDSVPRWGNGVVVYPYPTGYPESWDPCSVGSDRTKPAGDGVPQPKFSAQVVPFAETCSSYGIWDGGMSEEEAQARFVARAVASMEAVESATIEHEFMNGIILGTGVTAYLADGNGDFPLGDTATSVANAIGELENAIAATGRRGFIHCTPAFATAAARRRLVARDDRSGTLQTIVGTIMVPGDGYVGARPPHSHAAAGAHEEWVYATGPVDVRRGPIELLPDNVEQALDRRNNTIEYRAERLYVVSWDTVLQTAILADRCMDTCSS